MLNSMTSDKKSLIFYALNVIIQANLLACKGKFTPYSQD